MRADQIMIPAACGNSYFSDPFIITCYPLNISKDSLWSA